MLGVLLHSTSESSTALGRSPSLERRSLLERLGWSRRGFSSSKWYPYKKRSQVRPGLGRSNLRGSSYGAVGMRDDNQDRQEERKRRASTRDPEKCWQTLHVTKETVHNHSKPAHAATLLPAAGKPGKL